MATGKIGLSIWLGTLTIIWSLYPLLFSQARGILVFSLLTATLALAGWLTGLSLLVIWSGGLGLCNLTLALVLTAYPPNLWAGLSAGLILLALIDSSYRFTYIKHCWLTPGTVAILLRTFVHISGLTLAVGIVLGALLILLGQQPLAASATSLLTLTGACLFIGFLAAFLLYTDH
jgi:hypothetical protein